MATTPKVTILKDEEQVIEVKIMEDAILQVAEAARVLLNSKLTKREIVVLIKDSMTGKGLPLHDIQYVLDCAAKLDKTYLKS